MKWARVIKGDTNISNVERLAASTPRAWDDQRGIVNASDPTPPQALDLSILETILIRGKKRRR
jgi:hypothetical protein